MTVAGPAHALGTKPDGGGIDGDNGRSDEVNVLEFSNICVHVTLTHFRTIHKFIYSMKESDTDDEIANLLKTT